LLTDTAIALTVSVELWHVTSLQGNEIRIPWLPGPPQRMRTRMWMRWHRFGRRSSVRF